jgi:hypothetical protein
MGLAQALCYDHVIVGVGPGSSSGRSSRANCFRASNFSANSAMTLNISKNKNT